MLVWNWIFAKRKWLIESICWFCLLLWEFFTDVSDRNTRLFALCRQHWIINAIQFILQHRFLLFIYLNIESNAIDIHFWSNIIPHQKKEIYIYEWRAQPLYRWILNRKMLINRVMLNRFWLFFFVLSVYVWPFTSEKIKFPAVVVPEKS
jgi:hypothetical protein